MEIRIFESSMIYITNNSHDPYYNQAFEEYVFNTFKGGTIVLLWRNNPAVVCGCHQNIFAEVNVIKAQAKGVSIVRRITGGGTVFHDLGNLNYTIISDKDSKMLDYTKYMDFMINVLRKLGVPASLNRTSDIAIGGLKISGSAQKVTKNRVLHHGTLLFNSDLKTLSGITKGQRSYFETKGIQSVPWPVTNIINHMENTSMTTKQFGERLLEAIVQDSIWETMEISAEDHIQIKRLADDKYKSWEWTYGNTPDFTYNRSFDLDGEPISVSYQAKGGIITQFSIDLSEPDLEEALCGQKLSVPDIREKLLSFPRLRDLYKYLF
ncbi:MAG: lipoate--protein ligase [Clostridiales bacterium]|nr:lipoate--protein ligase [Clostridiales bacterium]